VRLSRQGSGRCGGAGLSLQRLSSGTTATSGGHVIGFLLTPGRVTRGGFSSPFRSASLGGLQINARSTRFGQADGNCLFGGTCAVLARSDVLDFFTHEFASLSARGLAFALVFEGALLDSFFRHCAISGVRLDSS
jgi:hypothetical protein